MSKSGCLWRLVSGVCPGWGDRGYGLGAVRVTGVCACLLMHAEVGAVVWVCVFGCAYIFY